ncbi:NfeD family protein [Moraxella macacae]|nr:NfeD family protein [Moraxella macacae]
MSAEILLPSFFLLWLGVASILTAVIFYLMPATFDGYLSLVVLWLILSAALCALWFVFINPKIKTRTKSGLGAGVIIGDVGMIVVPPTPDAAGLVRFSTPKAGATEWACRAQNELLTMGDRVLVSNILGNELLVTKL